ncbi:hypothetical protein [Roseospira navarrensis]|uniref:Uncharacterized protein n=1 Tax=Roseospira navarrensis TaxID=140058 RepID=A0A7X1ZEP5_9PROT|nr:hypothetical protein [Roseospira navarrensis]MQX35865.1 hypothetical protein [Roseospira navarrensis]
MPTDTLDTPRPRRAFGMRDRAAALVLGLAALALIAVGVQGLRRDLDRIPPTQYVQAAADRMQGEDEALRTETRVRTIALYEAMAPAARRGEDLRRWAGVHLMIADDAAAAEEADRARAHAGTAAALARRSLRHDPVHPKTWAHLSHALWLEQAEPAAAFGALRQSYAFTAVEPELTGYRLERALDLSSVWTVPFMAMMRQDLRGLLALHPGDDVARAFQTRAAASDRLAWLGEVLTRRDPALRDRWRLHAPEIGL